MAFLGSRKSSAALSLVSGALAWEIGVRWLGVKEVILPSPTAIASAFQTSWRTLFLHAGVSAAEALLGFVIGSVSGLLLAAAFHLSSRVRAALEPYLVASQVVPKVALAPLFVIWYGYGMQPKVIISALTCLFPTFLNAFQGLSSSDRDLVLMMRCLRAGRWTTLVRLQLPCSVPYITSGLKMAAVLSVIGAVMGEIAGADRGLGFLLLQAEAQLNTPLLFASLLMLSVIGTLMYALVMLVESTVLRRYMPERSGVRLLGVVEQT
ncbi:MAG: ABC transporter permease [Elusimicrobia bacterium]|nr:ABC transporter permease [Elusimicrobiota bacterium]